MHILNNFHITSLNSRKFSRSMLASISSLSLCTAILLCSVKGIISKYSEYIINYSK